MNKFTLQISILTIIFSVPSFAQNLTVAAGGELYISPSAFVHASSDVEVDASGDLIMDSTSTDFSDFYVEGTSTGTAEYRRFTASSATRDLVSPPVSGQTFMSFATANSEKIAAGSITPLNLMYGPFDTASGSYVEYHSSETAPLVSGKGYRVGTTTAGTLTYEGTIATEDVTIPLDYDGSTEFKYINLVGNPFTTHIDGGDILSALKGHPQINQSFASIYGWNGSGTRTDPDTWKVIHSLSSNKLITPGQGFIIISSTEAGSFTFPASARKVSATAQDDFITGRQATSTLLSFKLRLTKANNVDETSIYFVDHHGTRGLDVTYDTGSLGSDIGTHLVENSQGINMAIQVLSTDDLMAEDYSIPVEVSVTAGQEVTISVEDSNLPSGTEFYLDDTELNIQTLITSNDYTFTASSALSGIGRFYLRTTSGTFSSPSTALDAVEIISLTATRKLVVQGQLRNDSTLILYDITGRLIQTHQLQASQTRHEIDVSNVSSGVYVANLNNKHQSKTTKLVIK